MNAYEVRQAWCLLQVKLRDPCLSALKWSLPYMALYKCSALPFTGSVKWHSLFCKSLSFNGFIITT